MEKRYVVRLTDDRRTALEGRFSGPLTLRQRNRVQVLLRADRGETDGVPAELDGKAEAMVIAPACSGAPGGRARWTAKMLANRLVELEVVESISDDTILRVLKKTRSSRGRSGRGAFPRA